MRELLGKKDIRRMDDFLAFFSKILDILSVLGYYDCKYLFFEGERANRGSFIYSRDAL